MKGTFRVIVSSKRLRYDFVVRRNLTIIKGDSATGKTTLVDMIQEHMDHSSGSPVTVTCDRPCFALSGALWRQQLAGIQKSIVFIDEGNEFIRSEEFAKTILSTDNYYVIVSRESLPMLPYSITEIYGIRTSEKYGSLVQSHHELYQIYGKEQLNAPVSPSVIITEDSNAGYQFYRSVCDNSAREISCISAKGKSNVFHQLKLNADSRTIAIVDGAAFGPEIDRVEKLLQDHRQLFLYAPESFEWLVLSSGIPDDDGNEISTILRDPPASIESSMYPSWERFFTTLLTEKTKGSIWEYTKRKLNFRYLTAGAVKRILAVMKMIDIE